MLRSSVHPSSIVNIPVTVCSKRLLTDMEFVTDAREFSVQSFHSPGLTIFNSFFSPTWFYGLRLLDCWPMIVNSMACLFHILPLLFAYFNDQH